jgi:predicted metal-dependent phosphoesterase TrpH
MPERHGLALHNVELHCHTCGSKDSLIRPARLLEICRSKGIDRIAITDHNTITGALEAAMLDPERVIVSEEIMTTQGELLAYFVREEVPPGLTPHEALARLRQQGTFVSVAHPFDVLRAGGWAEADLRAILPLVDALEVFNARTWGQKANRQAAALASEAGLLGTAGSDAHTYGEVGRTLVQLPPFSDAPGLRQALMRSAITARGSSPLVHLLSRYAALRKRLGWNAPQGEWR